MTDKFIEADKKLLIRWGERIFSNIGKIRIINYGKSWVYTNMNKYPLIYQSTTLFLILTMEIVTYII
jgi:hypothetical protein